MYWPFKIWDVGTLWYGPNVHSNCCWHWLKRLRYLHVLAVFFTLQQPLTSEKACVYQYFIDKFTTITLFYNIGIMYFFRHVRNLCWKLLVLWLHRVCKWRLDSHWRTAYVPRVKPSKVKLRSKWLCLIAIRRCMGDRFLFKYQLGNNSSPWRWFGCNKISSNRNSFHFCDFGKRDHKVLKTSIFFQGFPGVNYIFPGLSRTFQGHF